MRILAWVHVVFGGLGLAICAAFVVVAGLLQDEAYGDELVLFTWLFGTLAIAYFIPSFFGGLGLLKRWPWARAIIWMESALLVVAIPVGTVLAGLNLWVLVTTRSVSADGGIAKFEAFVRRSIRPLVLALIAIATLGTMIGLGYIFRDVIDPPREQILTPMPSGIPPKPPERPEFKMPERPVAPGR